MCTGNKKKHRNNSNSDVTLVPKFVLSAGAKMCVSDYSYLTFHGDYSQQGGNSETIAGMLYSIRLDDQEDPKHTISGGAFIRCKDALIPVVKFDLKPLAFAFSYDVNISALKTASQVRGGFEFSLSYLKFFDRNNSSRDAVRCPLF
ncbi:MAG: type IX secretion system membrane protein PorP/SprF [Ginsengibacter sp.]